MLTGGTPAPPHPPWGKSKGNIKPLLPSVPSLGSAPSPRRSVSHPLRLLRWSARDGACPRLAPKGYSGARTTDNVRALWRGVSSVIVQVEVIHGEGGEGGALGERE